MKREDAYYFKILLMSGFSDGYDEWLNEHLEAQESLSDIVLDLSLCGCDVNKTISCLHRYCAEQKFDKSVVCDKLRLFLKDAYHSNRLSKEEIISFMYRFAVNHAGFEDYESSQWFDMFYMEDYYSLAKSGIIPRDKFDCAFLSYLDDGVSVDSKAFWNDKKSASKSLHSKIKNLSIKK